MSSSCRTKAMIPNKPQSFRILSSGPSRSTYHRVNRLNLHTTCQRQQDKINVEKLLATPTWSVEALLSQSESRNESPAITTKQLHHLLRLSALPPPKDAEEEAKMLATLSSQLHFVNDIRKVDTTGVKPLQSLRDETSSGIKESEIGIADLQSAFDNEEIRGKYYKRIRRRQDSPVNGESAKTWDVFGAAPRKIGRYFVVDGGKDA